MNASTRAPEEIVTTFAWDETLETLYASWRRRAEATQRIHTELAQRLERRRAALTVVAVLAIAALGAIAIAPVVAPAAYARATATIDRDWVSILQAALALVGLVLVVVQHAARLGRRAEDHRIAALRYASLARVMTLTAAMPRDVRGAPDDAISDARRRLDRYARESPRLGIRRRRRLEAGLEETHASRTLVLEEGASAERFAAG